MYLYVQKSDGLEKVPEALLARFGKPQQAMTLVLEPGRKLAVADAEQVLAAIVEQGVYLQMPPTPDESMRAIHEKNSKISR